MGKVDKHQSSLSRDKVFYTAPRSLSEENKKTRYVFSRSPISPPYMPGSKSRFWWKGNPYSIRYPSIGEITLLLG